MTNLVILSLPAVLTHAKATEFESSLKAQIEAQPSPVVIEAGQLKEFDSSALAVLLSCRRHALSAGKGFSVNGLPARLHQLASLYGVAELIS